MEIEVKVKFIKTDDGDRRVEVYKGNELVFYMRPYLACGSEPVFEFILEILKDVWQYF